MRRPLVLVFYLLALPAIAHGVESGDSKQKNKMHDSDHKITSNINYLHDIEPLNKDNTVNCVVEITAGTIQKWEISKSDGSIIREHLEGRPRTIKYIGYPANYGIVPMTLLPKNKGGDGDPVDIILLGPPKERGSVVAGKIIGRLNLVDNGETDHKLIAVQKYSSFFDVNSIAELDKKFPGASRIIEIWFANYKGRGKIKTKGFSGAEESIAMLQQSINEFKIEKKRNQKIKQHKKN